QHRVQRGLLANVRGVRQQQGLNVYRLTGVELVTVAVAAVRGGAGENARGGQRARGITRHGQRVEALLDGGIVGGDLMPHEVERAGGIRPERGILMRMPATEGGE